jgi:hypothetical protein
MVADRRRGILLLPLPEALLIAYTKKKLKKLK